MIHIPYIKRHLHGLSSCTTKHDRLTDLRGSVKPGHQVRCDLIFSDLRGRTKITEFQHQLLLIHLKNIEARVLIYVNNKYDSLKFKHALQWSKQQPWQLKSDPGLYCLVTTPRFTPVGYDVR